MNRSATYGERVVIVEVHNGTVHLRTGHIASTDSSHLQADNRNRTVVWSDRRFHPAADHSDGAYEKTFEVDDIHLLTEQEARSLQDLESAQDRFGLIYKDRLVTQIQRALKRLQPK